MFLVTVSGSHSEFRLLASYATRSGQNRCYTDDPSGPCSRLELPKWPDGVSQLCDGGETLTHCWPQTSETRHTAAPNESQ